MLFAVLSGIIVILVTALIIVVTQLDVQKKELTKSFEQNDLKYFSMGVINRLNNQRPISLSEEQYASVYLKGYDNWEIKTRADQLNYAFTMLIKLIESDYSEEVKKEISKRYNHTRRKIGRYGKAVEEEYQELKPPETFDFNNTTENLFEVE